MFMSRVVHSFSLARFHERDSTEVIIEIICVLVFLAGILLIHARNWQDCVRREEEEEEGEEDVGSDQPSQKHQENKSGQGENRKGAQNWIL